MNTDSKKPILSLKPDKMHDYHPFDVQKLISEQRQLPLEYRLTDLAQLMKVENILHSDRTDLSFPRMPSNKNSIWQIATKIRNIEELPFIAEVLQADRVMAWGAALQSSNEAAGFSNNDGFDCGQVFQHVPVHDIRDQVLLANQTSDDAEWLEYLNQYLASYDVEPLALNEDSNQDRLFRIQTATSHEKYHGGPLVTIIMPVFNGSDHLEWAANSILKQSWTNIELIIVDDCSTDNSADVIRKIASSDSRVKATCTPMNSGPYVAKNMGLALSRGDLITGHDADDWAHPCRIENQVKHLVAFGQPVAIGHMLRMKPSGKITKIDLPGSFSSDGILKKACISTIFNADFFHSRLGSWDNVRFAADSEMLGRAAKAMGHPIAFANILTMLCLDLDSGLSNRPGSLIQTGGLTGDRLEYRLSWSAWHAKMDAGTTYLPLNHGRRYFEAPHAMKNHHSSSTEVPVT